MVKEDCTVATEFITTWEEIQGVGIDPPSLLAINEFVRLLEKPDFSSFIYGLGQTPLIINQVVRFSNLDFIPIKTNLLGSLLGSNDFSSSAIRTRYEAGLQVAQAQVAVAEFKDEYGNTVRDLTFVPPPNPY
jgi:hypothetical protein